MPENGGVVHDDMHRGLRADMAPLVETLVQLIQDAQSPEIRNWAAKMLAELALAKTEESRTDALTQLPNMLGLRILFERLIAEVACSPNNRQSAPDAIGVISMDLVGFGDYNLTIGWDASSALLVDFARILEDSLRRGDFVSRIGGDEFIALFDLRKEQLLASQAATFEELLESFLDRFRAACAAYNEEMYQLFVKGVIEKYTPLSLHARSVVITREDLQRRFRNGTPLTLADVIRLADPKHRRG